MPVARKREAQDQKLGGFKTKYQPIQTGFRACRALLLASAEAGQATYRLLKPGVSMLRGIFLGSAAATRLLRTQTTNATLSSSIESQLRGRAYVY